MDKNLRDYAKLGINHHAFFPCKDNPKLHVETLPRIVGRTDIDQVDLTIPYGDKFRKAAIDIVRESGKIVVYNGYLMPTVKIPLGTLSYTERAQNLLLAKDQVDVAYECGAKYFMQSIGADPGDQNREKAFDGLGEYIYNLSEYMESKGNMTFLIELMDRNMDKRSLCGPTGEVIEFVEKLSTKVPNIGVVLDLNHLVLMEEDFSKAFTACKKYLKHVHLGNCILKDRSHQLWGGVHPPIGIEGGEIDIPELTKVLKVLLDIGYLNEFTPGTMSLEVKAFPGQSVEDTIDDNINRIYKAWEMV